MTVRYHLWTPSLRSAHLERLQPLPGIDLRLLASGTHPDCDPVLLADPPVPVTVAALPALAASLAADPPDVLEVTEPRWRAHWSQALTLASAAPGARLVTYAIDNLPPVAAEATVGLERLAAVAFGSADAQLAYAAAYPSWRPFGAMLPERRASCHRCYPAGASVVDAQREVVLAAELGPRKGVDVLLAAWPAVAVRAPGWRLRLLGWGPLVGAARTFAGARDDVEVAPLTDRAGIHAALRRAAVVVLPSRRVEGWREQVGLSLVEGPAHGCRVVTTTETGIAAELAAAGHEVVAPDDVAALTAGLLRAVRAAGPTKLLPVGEDSRMAATRWLAG